MRSCTCPVVILKHKNVPVHVDEDMFLPADGGVAHPFPPPSPRWMGMDGPNMDGENSVGNSVSQSVHGSSGGDVHMSNVGAPNDGGEAVDAGLIDPPAEDQPAAEDLPAEDSALVDVQLVQAAPRSVSAQVIAPVHVAPNGPMPSMIMPAIPPGIEHTMAVKVNNCILTFSFLPISIYSPSHWSIKYLIFDLDTSIPRYLDDHVVLSYLASIACDPYE